MDSLSIFIQYVSFEISILSVGLVWARSSPLIELMTTEKTACNRIEPVPLILWMRKARVCL